MREFYNNFIQNRFFNDNFCMLIVNKFWSKDARIDYFKLMIDKVFKEIDKLPEKTNCEIEKSLFKMYLKKEDITIEYVMENSVHDVIFESDFDWNVELVY